MIPLHHVPANLSAHPRWCALLFGVLAACGFEPLRLWPLTLLAMAGLIELIARANTARQAWTLGWLFGVGHFALGNNWIAMAFTYQAQMPYWLGWVAVIGLALFLALYPALARKHGASFYPFFVKGVAFNPPLLLDDGIHPNRQGVAVMVRNILPTVSKSLEALPPAVK